MQATDPVFYGGTLNGVLNLNGRIACSPVTGRKIDIYNDGGTIYGLGLNDFEYCIFGGEGSALTYRIARAGALDLAGDIALYVNATGLGLPAGNPISWGSNTLLVNAAGALLVNGAPVGGGGGSYNAAAVAITGGTINGTSVGATTAAAGRFSTLFSASVDLEGGTIDATAIGNTTAGTGRFSTLTATGFLQRSTAAALTASTTNTQAGALGLTASINIVTTAAANSAVRLPNAAPAAGMAAEIVVRNNGAGTMNCYPPVNARINSLAVNALIAIAAGTAMTFQQTSATQYYVT